MAGVTQSQVGPVMVTAEGIIVADMGLQQRSELLRLVPPTTAAAITTTDAMMPMVIGSVPDILIEPR
jgi:hypothetical protein